MKFPGSEITTNPWIWEWVSPLQRFIFPSFPCFKGFVQNQNRARNLQDPSVLPDLCASHRKQLKVMLKNHQNMQDIRNRCTAAKEELSANLHTRLRWVMYVERTICDVDSKLVLHHETLKKLRKRLEILQQMHNAPTIYCSAVVEVVRRRDFSRHFLKVTIFPSPLMI